MRYKTFYNCYVLRGLVNRPNISQQGKEPTCKVSNLNSKYQTRAIMSCKGTKYSSKSFMVWALEKEKRSIVFQWKKVEVKDKESFLVLSRGQEPVL